MTDIDTAAKSLVVDLNQPYLGWLNHFSAGWQAVIVRQIDGSPHAYRLGDELTLERVTEMCGVLCATTGVPVAGELAKRGFRPVGGDRG